LQPGDDALPLAITANDTTAELDGVAGIAVDVMEALGAPGAGLLIAAENLFPPIPSEVILPLAGFTASQGGFSVWSALFFTTMGSVVGAVILYYIGEFFGLERIHAIAERLPLIHASDIDKTVAWFNDHGTKAVFFGRMLPVFRSLISIPAGLHGMRLPKFVLLTTAGSLIWNTIFVMAGFWLGERWHRVEPYADTLQKIVIAAVVILAAAFVAWRLRKPLPAA
jgi:membrane protein DedA with SNARE-associated domain